MIPRTFLYDEYIGRPKFTEQKNPFEYIVPPPTSGVGTKINYNFKFQVGTSFHSWISHTTIQEVERN